MFFPSQVMCLQYWPMTRFVFGEIQIETLETKNYAYFIVRTFKITKVSTEVL